MMGGPVSLMTDHIHVIPVAESADGRKRAIGKARRRYKHVANFPERSRGHLG